VLLVAGDDKAAAEASDFLPGVETVTTKRAHGFNAAVSLHPNAAANAIALGVRNALARLEEMRPFTFDEPCEVEIRSKRIEFAESAARQPGWERVDAWTVRRTCQSLADIW
jgi:D-amino peptidase